MKRTLFAMPLVFLLLLSACAAPAEPLSEETPAAPQETEPIEETPKEEQSERPDASSEEEPAPSGEIYTIDLCGRDDLLFSCTVWTDDEGETDVELPVTDEVRSALGRIFDRTVVEASEMPANIPCIFLTAGTCRIMIDEYGFVSVTEGDFVGGYELSSEQFSVLYALLPENSLARIA